MARSSVSSSCRISTGKISPLTRCMITFRPVGDHYRRGKKEVHHIRLYRSTAHQLRHVGFKVQTMRSYGQYRLPQAHAAFMARTPPLPDT